MTSLNVEENALPKSCPVCGWAMHNEFDNRPCDPVLGRAATALQEAVPEVASTKLGYGDRRLTFEICEDFCIGFDVRHLCNKDGTRDSSRAVYNWQYRHALGKLSHDDAQDLVHALRDWKEGCLRRRAKRDDFV